MINLVTGILGIAMLAVFIGYMVVWVKALPLTIIVVVVMLLLVYDFVLSLRSGRPQS